MSDTVIHVENLSKKYIIGHQTQERYSTLRDAIANRARSLTRKLQTPPFGKRKLNPTREEFWALKDVSFEIKQGDRVGIIGRNGAGKSTLLKVLSRITEPTTGRISIKGRVASLLEVGTGFHPELTGRENIYLNGAILGMSKAEIKKKFDEIVAFAEVETFLDTPVKRYSSGMYVRLAFAVAAHLEPEILIVDEVLAVGDTQFQKKCLGKMEEVGKLGRTVLFVSHNMGTIQSLCSRCILLQKGQVIADKSPNSVVQLYLQDASASNSFVRSPQRNGIPTIVSGKIILIPESTPTEIQIDVEIVTESKQKVALNLRLHNAVGSPVGYGDLGVTHPSKLIEINPDLNVVSFRFAIHQLALGSYFISLGLEVPWIEYLDCVDTCLCFEVLRIPAEENGCILSQTWSFGSVEFPLKLIR